MLLHAAGLLAADGALPINIRIVSDGEEEVGGQSIVEFLAAGRARRRRLRDLRRRHGVAARCRRSRSRPAASPPSTCACKTGAARPPLGHVRQRGAERDPRAACRRSAGILPRDGRVPDALRVGIAPVTDEERAGWAKQPARRRRAPRRRGGAVRPKAAEEFYLRTTAETSVEVSGILGGKPGLKNTTVISEAQANFTVRLAPGQTPTAVAPEVERLLHEAAPDGATIEVEELPGSTRPGLVAADAPVIKIAQDAFEHAFGIRPILTRSGGTLPIVPALARQGDPDDPDRLRAAGEQRPLAERADARRVLPARRRHDQGALHPPWRPLLRPSSSRRSPPSWRPTCSTACSATSASTRSRPTASTRLRRPRSSSTSAGCCATSWRRSGSRTSGSTSSATSTARCPGVESAPAIG